MDENGCAAVYAVRMGLILAVSLLGSKDGQFGSASGGASGVLGDKPKRLSHVLRGGAI